VQADLEQVSSAVYAHPWARTQTAARRPNASRRVVGTLHEPNAWTVGVILATGLVLIARHPIARAFGTEAAVHPVVAVEAPLHPHPLVKAPSLSLPLVAVATHAPRDPFRALVTTGGNVLAPAVAAVAQTTPATAVSVPAPPAAACTGRSHRVIAGDTLWTLAARAVRSSDTGRVTIAWHRLYDANRTVVGADPSVLQVGSALCVPQSL
jgi:nucleoid-associated protein YgaU